MASFSDYLVLELYRNAGTPVAGPVSGAAFAWPGVACTASTVKVYPELQGRQIAFARWVLAWNPSTGSSKTGVRLVYCDDGPSNIQEIGRQERVDANTPFDDTLDVTAVVQSVWDTYAAAGKYFQFGHQAYGNGANGPLIYGSWIEIGFV